MKVNPRIRLEDRDMNRLWDLLGMAYGAEADSDKYNELTVALKDATEILVQEAFDYGAQFALATQKL